MLIHGKDKINELNKSELNKSELNNDNIPIKKKKEKKIFIIVFLEYLVILFTYLSIAISDFKKLFAQLKEFILKIWKKIKEFIIKIWIKIRKFIIKVWIKIRRKLKPYFTKVYNFFGEILLYIISINYLQIIKFYFFDSIIRLIRGIYYFIINIIKNTIQGSLMFFRYLRLQIINLLFKLIKPSIYLIIILIIIYFIDYYDP